MTSTLRIGEGGGEWGKNEMLLDVGVGGGGGLASVLAVQSLFFFLLKKIGLPPWQHIMLSQTIYYWQAIFLFSLMYDSEAIF